MSLVVEMSSCNPVSEKNLAITYGFDPASIMWSEDSEVRDDLKRLCSLARVSDELGLKSFEGLDLRQEKPFNLKTAVFEDVDMQNCLLPAGTDLSNAHFIGCNVVGVNFHECKIEE